VLGSVSTAGEPINDLLITVTLIGAVVLAIVSGAVAYFAIRYRSRADGADGAPVFGNTRLELAWFVIPLAIVAVLFALSVRVAAEVEPPTSGREPDVVVVGHQWWWEVIYPEAGVVTANEIHVPTGARLLLQLESVDVIHDFWVPQVGRKIDAIPGHPNRIWILANRPGTYLGACAEYCGTQHAWMRLRVIAQPQHAFDAWLQRQTGALARPTSGEAARGAEIFESRTCANCHAVEGTARAPNVGPNLSRFSDRETIGAGVVENTPDNLERWLSAPQSIKPGSFMPDLKLTDQQVRALIAYLRGQP
jgi:cytochrome c oxidase subunit 2